MTTSPTLDVATFGKWKFGVAGVPTQGLALEFTDPGYCFVLMRGMEFDVQGVVFNEDVAKWWVMGEDKDDATNQRGYVRCELGLWDNDQEVVLFGLRQATEVMMDGRRN